MTRFVNTYDRNRMVEVSVWCPQFRLKYRQQKYRSLLSESFPRFVVSVVLVVVSVALVAVVVVVGFVVRRGI